MVVQELKVGNGLRGLGSSNLLKNSSSGFYNFQWERKKGRKKEMCGEGRRANKKPIRGSKKRQNGAATKYIFPFYYFNSDLFLLPVGGHAVFFPKDRCRQSDSLFPRFDIDKSIHSYFSGSVIDSPISITNSDSVNVLKPL